MLLDSSKKHFRSFLVASHLVALLVALFPAAQARAGEKSAFSRERCLGLYKFLQAGNTEEYFEDVRDDLIPKTYGTIPEKHITHTPLDVEIYAFQTNPLKPEFYNQGIEEILAQAKFDLIAKNMDPAIVTTWNNGESTTILTGQVPGNIPHGISLTRRPPRESGLKGVYIQIPPGTELPAPFAILDDGMLHSFHTGVTNPRGHLSAYPYEDILQPKAKKIWKAFMEDLKREAAWGVVIPGDET